MTNDDAFAQIPVERVERPEGYRNVPLIEDHQIGHYPEFRQFLRTEFSLDTDPFAPPPCLQVGGRLYELCFYGRSGSPFPSGLRVDALAPDLEPVGEERIDDDLWTILPWLINGVGGEWTVEALNTTGRLLRVAPEQRTTNGAEPNPSQEPVRRQQVVDESQPSRTATDSSTARRS
jgi:hypothetical protein